MSIQCYSMSQCQFNVYSLHIQCVFNVKLYIHYLVVSYRLSYPKSRDAITSKNQRDASWIKRAFKKMSKSDPLCGRGVALVKTYVLMPWA